MMAMLEGTTLPRCRQLDIPITDEALAVHSSLWPRLAVFERIGDLREWPIATCG